MYKILIPNLTSEGLKQRALHLSFTTRNGASKIIWLKLGHCLLNYHKSKFDTETKPNCQEYNSKETPIYLHLDCNKFENERQKLKKAIKSILNKNKISWHSIKSWRIARRTSTKTWRCKESATWGIKILIEHWKRFFFCFVSCAKCK